MIRSSGSHVPPNAARRAVEPPVLFQNLDNHGRSHPPQSGLSLKLLVRLAASCCVATHGASLPRHTTASARQARSATVFFVSFCDPGFSTPTGFFPVSILVVAFFYCKAPPFCASVCGTLRPRAPACMECSSSPWHSITQSMHQVKRHTKDRDRHDACSREDGGGASKRTVPLGSSCEGCNVRSEASCSNRQLQPVRHEIPPFQSPPSRRTPHTASTPQTPVPYWLCCVSPRRTQHTVPAKNVAQKRPPSTQPWCVRHLLPVNVDCCRQLLVLCASCASAVVACVAQRHRNTCANTHTQHHLSA